MKLHRETQCSLANRLKGFRWQLKSHACGHNLAILFWKWTRVNGWLSSCLEIFRHFIHDSWFLVVFLWLIKYYWKSPPFVPVLLWLTLQGTIPGPTISNKQRIQRWITVGIKSIAPGLPGTAIDYESVLVSRTPWWRKGIRRQEECREWEMQRKKKVAAINWHSCHIMLNIDCFQSVSCKLNSIFTF